MRRPLLALAACLLIGSLLPVSVTGRVPLVLGLVLGTLALVFWRPRARAAPAALAACAVAMASAGRTVECQRYDATPLRRLVVSERLGREPVRIEGELCQDPDAAGERWVLTMNVDHARWRRREMGVAGRVRVVVGGRAERPHLVAGQRLALWARLTSPRGFANPGGFDRVALSRRRGIHATAFSKSPLLVTPIASPQSLRLLLGRIRDRARLGLMRNVVGQEQQGLARALVLGDRTALDDDVEAAFRLAGTYHVLAISGAHVAIVVGLVLGLLRLMRCGRLTTAIFASAAVGVYAVFVGGAAPVVRAALMAATLLLGTAWGLGGEAANLLGLAAVVLLAWQPSMAADAGFQLSFSATLGILLLTPSLARPMRRLPRLLALPLAASLAAQISLAPLLLYHFHRLALGALVLNLVAVPVSGAVLVVGSATAAADIVAPPLAHLLGWATTWAASGLLVSSRLAQWLPGAHLRFPDPSWLALSCWLAAVVMIARRRYAWAGVWCALALAAFVAGHPPPADGRLHLTALDVGDGDALVLRSPAGRLWVVDAPGGRPGALKPGEAVVAPYLWHLGVTTIDRISVSHDHLDHVGGVPALLDAFGVGFLIEAPGGEAVPGSLQPSTRRRSVCLGDRETWDGVEVEVLWPACDPGERPEGNDGSLILRLRYGMTTLLLPGDAGEAVEPSLPADRIDILKVAHHGRRTGNSDAFLAHLSPRVAIVSVGSHGASGPPDPHLLAEMRRLGCRVLRTDVDGAVSVATDGARVWEQGYREGVTVRHPPRPAALAF